MQQLIDLRHETPEAISLLAIGAFMEVGRPAVVLFSGGKDSSVLLNLALTAAVEQARQGRNPMVVIAHSDVGVENPEIQRLVSGEIAKAARFAREHGVTAVVRVATPAFWDTFPVRVIGGRALPTFPDSRRDCQTDLKRLPNERELALIERELVAKGWPQPVLMTGVRRDESAVRAASVKGRGEKAVSLWTDTEGRLRLSPLLEWAVVDTANQFHLFVFMDRRVRMPVVFVEREGRPAPQKHARSVQRSEGCPSARKAVRSAEALA